MNKHYNTAVRAQFGQMLELGQEAFAQADRITAVRQQMRLEREQLTRVEEFGADYRERACVSSETVGEEAAKLMQLGELAARFGKEAAELLNDLDPIICTGHHGAAWLGKVFAETISDEINLNSASALVLVSTDVAS